VVRHAAQAQRALGLALIVLSTVAAGCGGGHKGDATRAKSATTTPVIHKDLGVDVRLADCTDWNRGDDAARRGMIKEIAGFAGGQVGSAPGNVNGATIPEAQAYALFNGWCSHHFARGFKLYKLYTRAAAFTPQS